MIAQHHVANRGRLDDAQQNARGLVIVGGEAEVDDLAHGGIAHQLVRHLQGDFHRRLRGALVAFAFELLFLLRCALSANTEVSCLLGAAEGGPADAADALGRLDVAERLQERLSSQTSPDFALPNHLITPRLQT
jgi:hypothetical protein